MFKSICNRMSSVLVLLPLWAACVLTCVPSPSAGQEESSVRERELEVKAAFLYNFAKYTEWPASAFSAPDTPLSICVFGDHALFEHLQPLSRKTLHGRTVKIVSRPDFSASGCHIAVITDVAKENSEAIRTSAKNQPVLTICDYRSPAAIVMYRHGDTIAFEVDLREIGGTGLTFSSQLLKVAKNVTSE